MTELTTTEKIITALDELQEIYGTEHLAYQVTGSHNKSWVIAKIRDLEGQGLISVIRSNGGRGKKTVIRKNRNSPGYPRRTR